MKAVTAPAAVVEIHTEEDLHRLLLHQKIINRQATQDLNEIVDRLPLPDTEQAEEQIAYQAIEMETALLDKYAKYPTLSEFAANPELRSLTKWGATLGVALIVGEVILRHIRTLQSGFANAQRGILTFLLLELHHPTGNGDVVRALSHVLKVDIRQDVYLTAEEKEETIIRLLSPVIETMLIVLGEYKMVESQSEGEGGYILTPFGRRVMRHLVDAQKFIEAVTEAHGRLHPGT